MTTLPRHILWAVLALCAATATPAADAPGTPWTFDEAVSRLRSSPRDLYLQYVALQLQRRQTNPAETNERLRGLPISGDNTARPDLFNFFTGGPAVQETLQLDTMRGDGQRGRPGSGAGAIEGAEAAKVAGPVALDKLRGPETPPHPWAKMLAGRTPDTGPLAACVPADNWYAEFRSFARLAAVLDGGELWGNHLFATFFGQAGASDGVARLKHQLGLQGAGFTAFDSLGVTGVAVTGSDPYLTDGSDVTVLLHTNQAEELAGRLKEVIARTPTKTSVVALRPDVVAVNNSESGLRRVRDAAGGLTALGASDEFRYVRTLMPRGASEEDGFVYLSDNFVRRAVGPAVKIGQRRRLVVRTHLRMIGYAALMFRTEKGRPPASLEELSEAKCAPGVFGRDSLADPAGGAYTLAKDGMSATHHVWGSADDMTPLLDVPVQSVTGQEAAEYKAFIDEYSQYWRTFFDPIAVRIATGPKQYRLETLVLPLIDNSIYAGLKQAVGGQVVALEPAPPLRTAIMSLGLKINKGPWVQTLPDGDGRELPAGPVTRARQRIEVQNKLKQIGLAMHNHHDVNSHLPASAGSSKPGMPPVSWRVLILPYLEEEALYRAYKLDEPWDSDHNKKLIPRMPKLYCGRGAAQLAERHKTPFLSVSGQDMAFPPGGKPTKFSDVKDGLSNTILVVEATDERAVVWTKPDDFVPDAKDPSKGLSRPENEPFCVLLGDASVRSVGVPANPQALNAAFTINKGENVGDLDQPQQRQPAGPLATLPVILDALPPGAKSLRMRRLMIDGIGDRVTLNFHDSQRLFDLDVSGPNGPASAFSGDIGGFGLLIQMLTSPFTVTIPVKDAKVVDDFFNAADRLADGSERGLGLGVGERGDFYKLRSPGSFTTRCFVIRLAGLKLRFFWGRVGDHLCFTNRPGLLEEVAAAGPADESGPRGHALLRVRPENFNAVLPGFNLGWAENEREADRTTRAMIENVARSRPKGAGGPVTPELLDEVRRVYGVRPSVPAGTTYTLSADGRTCTSSVYGDDRDPRQPPGPLPQGPTGKVLRQFGGLTATLRFEDDGLRAVVVIDCK